jgi:hypothetical protein
MPTRPLFPLLILAFLFCACQSVPAPTNIPTAIFPPSATPLPPTETSTALPPTATPRPTATVTPPPPDVPIYQLAYLDESSGLHLVNSDGFGETVLFEPTSGVKFNILDWSPAAGLFALSGYQVDAENRIIHTLFTLRLDGSGLSKVFLAAKGDNIFEFHWLADGKGLVFSSAQCLDGGEGACVQIPVLHRVRVQDGADEVFQKAYVMGDLSAAPYGQVVAYSTIIGRDIFGIKVMDLDSRKSTVIQSIPFSAGDGCGKSAWSPDGARLSFMCEVNKEVALYVVNADDSAPLKLVTGIQNYRQWSAWSPDGAWIAYTDGKDLWRIHPDGSDRQLIHLDKGGGGPMLWSPDGTRLAFNQAGDLFVVFVDGRYLQKIASGLTGDAVFTWISEKLP